MVAGTAEGGAGTGATVEPALGFRGGFVDGLGADFVQGAADPDFDADAAVSGMSAHGSEIDVGAEGGQRDDALFVALFPGDFGAAETSGAEDLATLGTGFPHPLKSFLHGGAEGGAVLELADDPLGHQVGIEVGVLDFDDLKVELAGLDDRGKTVLQGFQVLTVLAEDVARTGNEDLDGDIVAFVGFDAADFDAG